MTAGYSGTPLPKKLGIHAATHLVVLDEPAHYEALLGPLPATVVRQSAPTKATTLVHAFVTERQALDTLLQRLRSVLNPDAAVWVSWPKKASRVTTDVTEDTIRAVALPLGFVDIKVCAVDAVWSGLKLVVRKALR